LKQRKRGKMEKYIEKAKILIEALPYIQQFKKKIMVIKYGGSFMYDEQIKQSVMDDISLMCLVGIRPIIVHGGGKDISGLLNDLDIQTEFVEGLRVTNEKVVEVAEMVLSGKINKELVQLLQNREISAVGLSGKDGGMIKVKKKFVNDLDIGYVGEIFHIDDKILKAVLKEDFLPVIAPIGTDKTGQSFNINADHVACAIAGHLKAEKLIYLTDTDGVYMDPENQDSIIHRLFTDNVPKLIDEGIISGGMIPKVESSVQALNEGVKSVHILDGKVEHSLLLELFTAAGVGTMIRESIV